MIPSDGDALSAVGCPTVKTVSPTRSAIHVPAAIGLIDPKTILGEIPAYQGNASGTNRAHIVNCGLLLHVQRPLRLEDPAAEALMRLAKKISPWSAIPAMPTLSDDEWAEWFQQQAIDICGLRAEIRRLRRQLDHARLRLRRAQGIYTGAV